MGLVDGRVATVQLQLIEPGFQRFHRNIAVLMLRFLGACHYDPGRVVRDAHGRIGRVHMLPPRAGTAIGVDADIGRVHLDIDIVIDNRIDPD